MNWFKINPIKRIKAWIYSKIAKAVRRELNIIFRECGEVNVDHHLRQDSLAVIKVDTGPHTCYLKFINLGKRDLREIVKFLDMFPHKNIDSMPEVEHQIHKMYNLFNY